MQSIPPHSAPPGRPFSGPYMDYFSLPPGAPAPGIPMTPGIPPILRTAQGLPHPPGPWPPGPMGPPPCTIPMPMTPMPMLPQPQMTRPVSLPYVGHEPLQQYHSRRRSIHIPAGFQPRLEHTTIFTEGVYMSEDDEGRWRQAKETYARDATSSRKRKKEKALLIKAERRRRKHDEYGSRSDGVTRDKARTKPQNNSHEAPGGYRRSYHNEDAKLDRERSKSRHRPSPETINNSREVPGEYRRSYFEDYTKLDRQRSKSRHRPSPETVKNSREVPRRHRRSHNSERVKLDRERSRSRHSPSPHRDRPRRGRTPRPVSPPLTHSTMPPAMPPQVPYPPTPPQTPRDGAQPTPSPNINPDSLEDDAQPPTQLDSAEILQRLIDFFKQAGQKLHSDDTHVHLRGGGSKAPSVLSNARLHGSHRRGRTTQSTWGIPRRRQLRGISVLGSDNESSDEWDVYDTEEEIVVEEKPRPKHKKQSRRAKGKMERQTHDAILHQRHAKSKAVGSRRPANLSSARRPRPEGERDGELNLIVKGFLRQLARAIRGGDGWDEQGVPGADHAGKFVIGIMPPRSMSYQGMPGYLPYDTPRLLTFPMM